MKNKKYFIYVRSAVKSKNAVTLQINHLVEFAKILRIEIADIIMDSGSGFCKNRPNFIKMLKRLQKGEAKGILCTRWDRITRDATFFLELKARLKKDGIKIVTANDPQEPLDSLFAIAYVRRSTS